MAYVTKNQTLAVLVAIIVGFGLLTATVNAAPGEGHVISDGFSTMKIYLPGSTGGSFDPTAANTDYGVAAESGVMYLDRNNSGVGADHIQDLRNQTYFISINNGAAVELYTGLTALSSPLGNLIPNTGVESGGNLLNSYYGNSDLEVHVGYTLTGSQATSFTDSLARELAVYNKTNTAMNVTIYSYTNLGLTLINEPNPIGWRTEPGQVQVAQLLNPNQLQQYGTVDGITKVSDSSTTGVGPSHWMIGDATAVKTLLNGYTGNLSDSTSGTYTNPAQVFQYTFTVAPNSGGTFVSEVLTVTPEPASLMLLGLGAGMILLPRRRVNR